MGALPPMAQLQLQIRSRFKEAPASVRVGGRVGTGTTSLRDYSQKPWSAARIPNSKPSERASVLTQPEISGVPMFIAQHQPRTSVVVVWYCNLL